MARTRKYVVLPEDNIFNERMETTSFRLFHRMHQKLFGKTVALAGGTTRPPLRLLDTDAGRIRLLDSIGQNEASLVSMTPEQAFALQRTYPGLRVRPELVLRPLKLRRTDLIRRHAKPSAFRSKNTLLVRCVDAGTGKPVAGAALAIVLDAGRGFGIADAVTDKDGIFRTPLPAAQTEIDAVICSPLAGYWPGGTEAVPVSAGETKVTIELTAIDDGFEDSLTRMTPPAKKGDGKGVRVAIVDTGVAPAKGLDIALGLNTTGTEPAEDWGDNGTGHGTHVAGIVARVAPEVQLHAYRVFEAGDGGASEFAIARAIRQAVDDGCDIVNLSLGQGSEPISISREVRRARAMGVVCVAATGNDYMAPVSWPAKSGATLAVSAGGAMGAWPDGAITARNVAPKPKPAKDRFFANFSNIGPEVDFIGPGVGIISWVSETARGVMDGTSMACPAAAGMIARILSRNPAILSAERNQQRSDDIVRLANEHATPLGFGKDYEGGGLIEG